MTTPEGKFNAQIQKYLKSLGAQQWSFKVHGSHWQKAGVPDTVGCFRSRFFAIEAKAPKGEASPKQLHEIDLIRRSGGKVIIARTMEEVEEFMNSIG